MARNASDGLRRAAISVTVSCMNELMKYYSFNGKQLFQFLDAKGTSVYLQNEATMMGLGEVGREDIIKLFSGDITLEEAFG